MRGTHAAAGQGAVRSVGGGSLPPLTFPVIAFPIPSIGHNEVIGVCRVGPEAADPHGREHWAEMLANPRKPVEHWHQLVEVSGPPLPRVGTGSPASARAEPPRPCLTAV